MRWVEGKREGKRERGGERGKRSEKGGSVREERRKKGSKYLSMKYTKHKNIKSLHNCHYICVVTI